MSKARTKGRSVDNRLIPRYERCLTDIGVVYYIDHKDETRSWEPPDEQEMCLKISDPPLSKRWEEKHEGGRILYVHRLTGETRDERPGASEIWAVKKRLIPEWVKSSIMALPGGWELHRTDDGGIFYLNHNVDPPSPTTYHPMRREIEAERQILLPKWNVEWDDERGKKYRNLHNGDIRWKAVDGPKCLSFSDEARSAGRKTQQDFVEPLPQGWTFYFQDGQKVYNNCRDGIERSTHPLSDKRRILLPAWEMRYTSANRRYWVHHGADGRGTTWWTRNRLLKNTSLKNNASGWKLTKDKSSWEWFEGGDVAHGEIPVLDLDDPAEIEFREYPFLLPDRIVDADRSFLEPLPFDWVRRTRSDGNVYYWNFKSDTQSDQHPMEEEREHLPALWEMRYTRHGRQYFVHHDTGKTWWTHPREDKHKQVLRAHEGQSQDGWRQAEDGKSWVTFVELPDVSLGLQNTKSWSSGRSDRTDNIGDEGADTWRSLNFTKNWLKNISPNDKVATAITQFQDQTRVYLSETDGLPPLGQWLVKNTQRKQSGNAQVDHDTTPAASPTISEELLSSPETPKDPSPVVEPRSSWGRTSSNLLNFAKKKGSMSSAKEPSLPDEQLPEDTSRSPEDALGLTRAKGPDVRILSRDITTEPALGDLTDPKSRKAWGHTTSDMLQLAKRFGSKANANDTSSPNEQRWEEASQILKNGLGLVYPKRR